MSCRRENVILRLPWLQTTNPTIDWSHQTISILETCDQSKDLYSIHATDTKCHNTYFRKLLPQIPRYVNVDAVTNQHLYEFLHHEIEDQFIEPSTRSFEGTPTLSWDPWWWPDLPSLWNLLLL